MAILNFPANPSPGDTYNQNGVIYTFTDGKWTSATQLTSGNFVLKTGDTMTGSLKVGDRSFNSNTGNYGADVALSDGSNYGAFYAQAAGTVATPENIDLFEGRLGNTATFSVKANGSAEFAGTVESFGKPNTNTPSDYGWGLYQGPASEGYGGLWLKCDNRTTEANAYALSIRGEDGSDVAHIKYDGSARFDRGIALGYQGGGVPNAEITLDGTATFAGGLDVSGSQTSNIVAMAALDVNCSQGNYFTKTISGNSTFTFSNAPSGKSFAFTLEVTHTGGTITWPAAVKWPADTAPTLTTGYTHLFVFVTDDSGSRWRGAAIADYAN